MTLAPWEVFKKENKNKSLSIAAPRPDFQGAIIQFLIGLVQTTASPGNEDEWVEGLQSLPDEAQVKKHFEKVSPAFNLCGDGPRFMQDSSCNSGEDKPIDTLLIGMPGENTLKLNRDFFQKRQSVNLLCPTCAAMALFTLQLNGPQGGQGHRAGLRGGGPLTSVILGKTLPETLWLNVLPEDEFFIGLSGERKNAVHNIFPWMGSLRTSEGGDKGLFTGISDASQLQMFWGMGRRILLGDVSTDEGFCDVCGDKAQNLFTTFKTKNYGIRYDESWRHTLTPCFKSKDEKILHVHLQRDGITYRHWLGLVQNDIEEGREVARVVQRFKNLQSVLTGILPRWPQLWAFGYDFKKVEARCWYDSYMPLIQIDETIRGDYEVYTAQIVRTAQYINEVVHGAVKDALYKSENQGTMSEKKSKPQKNPKTISIVKTRFWSETENLFYDTLSEFKNALQNRESVDQVKRNWVMRIRDTSLILFDFYSQSQYLDENRPKAVVAARKRLFMTVSPGAPKIMKLLALSKETR